MPCNVTRLVLREVLHAEQPLLLLDDRAREVVGLLFVRLMHCNVMSCNVK